MDSIKMAFESIADKKIRCRDTSGESTSVGQLRDSLFLYASDAGAFLPKPVLPVRHSGSPHAVGDKADSVRSLYLADQLQKLLGKMASVCDYLHIHKPVGGNAAHAAAVFYGYAALLAHNVNIQRFAKFKRKIKVAYRLYKKAYRVHLVPFLRILHEIGYKYERNRFIHLSQLDSGVHAVHLRHLYVHEHDGIHRLIVRQKINGVIKTLYLKLLPRRCRIFFYI